MLNVIASRVDGARTALRRATVTPFLVRLGIALAGLLAMSTAWPTAIVTSQFMVLLVLIAVYPAVVPRGRGATVSALIVVAGWLADTAGDAHHVALWRVLALATMLYLGHSLTALAAVLPYDAVVNGDVIGNWLARAGAVVLVSAVLTVSSLAITDDLAGGAFLIATLVGLAGAVGATMLIARLLRRP